MKKSVLVFPRDTYQSQADGNIRTYVCRDEVRRAMGQAKHIRFQLIGYRKSANARVTVKLWETPDPNLRPSEVVPGGTALFTGTAITALRSAPQQINGPFCDNVEMTLDIDEATPASQQEFDLEVWATLIIEE